MKQRQAIVDVLDLLTPARIFMNFVYIQIFPATGEETLGSIKKSVCTNILRYLFRTNIRKLQESSRNIYEKLRGFIRSLTFQKNICILK